MTTKIAKRPALRTGGETVRINPGPRAQGVRGPGILQSSSIDELRKFMPANAPSPTSGTPLPTTATVPSPAPKGQQGSLFGSSKPPTAAPEAIKSQSRSVSLLERVKAQEAAASGQGSLFSAPRADPKGSWAAKPMGPKQLDPVVELGLTKADDLGPIAQRLAPRGAQQTLPFLGAGAKPRGVKPLTKMQKFKGFLRGNKKLLLGGAIAGGLATNFALNKLGEDMSKTASARDMMLASFIKHAIEGQEKVAEKISDTIKEAAEKRRETTQDE